MAEVDYNKIQALLDSVNQPSNINPDDIHIDENDPEFLELMNDDMDNLKIDKLEVEVEDPDDKLILIYNNEISNLNKLTEELKINCIKLNRYNQKPAAIAALKQQKIGLSLLCKYEVFDPDLNPNQTHKAIEEIRLYIKSIGLTKNVNSPPPRRTPIKVISPLVSKFEEPELRVDDLEKSLNNRSSISSRNESIPRSSESARGNVVLVKSQFQKEIELQKLIERFKTQISTLEIEAKKALSIRDKDTATVLMRRIVSSKRDLSVFEAIDHNNINIPIIQSEKISYNQEIFNPDIPLDQIVFELNSFNLCKPFSENNSSWQLFCTLKVDHPSPENPTIMHTNDLAVKGGALFDLNFKKSIPLLRDKVTIRKFAFAKLTIEVWHKRFLWSNLLVGSVEIKLKDFLLKCSIPILKLGLKNSEKITAVEISGEIKMRTPLSNKEIRVVSFEYISLSAPEINLKADATPATNLQAPAPKISPLLSEAIDQKQINNPSSLNIMDIKFNQITNGIDNKDLRNPLSVDLIYGNDMLEHEKNELTERIVQCKSRSRTDPEANNELFEMQSRISNISIKLSLLEMEVSNGTLLPKAYVAKLEEYLNKDKKLAVALKQLNRLEEAKQVMVRIKIVTAEIESAKPYL